MIIPLPERFPEIPPITAFLTEADFDALLEEGEIGALEWHSYTGKFETTEYGVIAFNREAGDDYIPPLDFEQEVRNLARVLAAERNVELDQSRWLYREIISRGGIGRHKDGDLEEEYGSIPVRYRRKNGSPPDEIASEMGMTEAQLMAEIARAERIREELPTVRGKKVGRFRIKDMIAAAEQRVINEHGRIFPEEAYDERVPF